MHAENDSAQSSASKYGLLVVMEYLESKGLKKTNKDKFFCLIF